MQVEDSDRLTFLAHEHTRELVKFDNSFGLHCRLAS